MQCKGSTKSGRPSQPKETRLFVATNGNDAWSGTLAEPNEARTDGPFATLTKARDTLRQMKNESGLTKPATVMVRDGKYFLEETFVLTYEDSGTQDCPVTFTAYPGEKPVLSGGRKLTDWTPYKGDILQCNVPKAKGGKWRFRQLFFNGQRQIRARWPRFDPENPFYGGWAFMEGPAEEDSEIAFKYKPNTFRHSWAKPTEAEVHVYRRAEWDQQIIRIKAMDEDARTITLEHRGRDYDRAPRCVSAPFRLGNRFFVENVLEELDQPGQWCLDTEEGIVYFWPPSASIEQDEVVAPMLSCLIDIRGRTWRPERPGGFASWITVSGFTITETLGGDSVMRDGALGYSGFTPIAGVKYCGESLRLLNAEHCCVKNNHFYAVGGNAIYLEGYNARHAIHHNDIGHAGANGICVLGGRIRYPFTSWHRSHGTGGKGAHPIYNDISDNHIHDTGTMNKYSVAVFLGFGDGNFVRHNLIEKVPNMGICIGDNGYGRNIVEYNIIRNVALACTDVGAIHFWMEDEGELERSGHVIRYNLITDNISCKYDEEGNFVPNSYAFGIYIDNYASNCFVYGNIIARCYGSGIFIHSGKNNMIENNIIVGSHHAQVGYCYTHDAIPGFYSNNHFCRNILYSTDPEALLYVLHKFTDLVLAQSDYNIFFNAKGGEYSMKYVDAFFSEGSLENTERISTLDEWRKNGYEEHSVTADPLFVDPANDDYRLRPESPALRLGFQQTDVARIGIRKEKQ